MVDTDFDGTKHVFLVGYCWIDIRPGLSAFPYVISTGLNNADDRPIPIVTEAIFYADIALDIKQLFLFYNNGLVDYCLFNGLGILIPPIVTMREALRWQHRPSPEKDFVNCLIKSDFLQKMFIVVAIVSQMHMLVLVMLSVHFRKTPDTYRSNVVQECQLNFTKA